MVTAGQPLVIVESMEMEMEIDARRPACRIAGLRCQPGRAVRAGDVVALLEEVLWMLPTFLDARRSQRGLSAAAASRRWKSSMPSSPASPAACRPRRSGSGRVNERRDLKPPLPLVEAGRPRPTKPLWGIPFAVKDNIDLPRAADHGRLPRLRL